MRAWSFKGRTESVDFPVPACEFPPDSSAMRLFLSGATSTLRRYPDRDRLGVLLVPASGNTPRTALDLGLPWAADNAAFSGFDPAAFCGLLARIGGRPGCRFVACPDVVGNAGATFDLFRVWAPVLRAVGVPVALVAQDGLDEFGVPWDEIDALFVGGSTDWKLGRAAASLTREAKARGLWVHMGRVNTRFRVRYAHGLGCDSIDGSGFSRWPDQRVPAALRWLAELDGGVAHTAPAEHPELFRGGDSFAARGWHVDGIARTPTGFEVTIRSRVAAADCPRCGIRHHRPPYKHGWRSRTVWDIPRGGTPVRLNFRRHRFRCRACRGTYLEATPDVRADCPLTTAAAEWLTGPDSFHTPANAATQFGVSPKTVRRWRRKLKGKSVSASPVA